MIKVYTENCITFQADDFEVKDVLRLLQKNIAWINVKFLIYNKERVVGIISAPDIVNGNKVYLIAYEIDWDIFNRARDFYNANPELRHIYIPITDVDGNYLFSLYYVENMIKGWGNRNYCKQYPEYDIFEDKENNDYTFLKKYDTYIFEELDEYTFAVTNLLKSDFPDKKIIYKDSCISFFYDDIYVCRASNFIYRYADIAASAVISSDLAKCSSLPFDNRRFSSVVLFESIVWCKKRVKFGELNPDKTVYLIDYDVSTAGLWDIAKFTLAHYLLAKERGWLPVICLNKYPNQFLESEKDNMWDYYFENLSEISVTDAYKSANVISACENGINLEDNRINIYQSIFYDRFRDVCLGYAWYQEFDCLKLNSRVLDAVCKKSPNEIINKNARIYGIIARGTDLKKENVEKIHHGKRIPDINTVLDKAEYDVEIYGCDYIFVATEDEIYLNEFKKRFGSKLLYIEQKRFNLDNDKNYVFLSSKVEKEENRRKIGEDYLTALWCLSKCDILVSNVLVGAYDAAKYFNGGKYEYSEIMSY